jgi:peptide/nickel transport system substrate-binding protein
VIRPTALLAAIAVSLLAVSGAGGAPAQTPKRGGTVVVAASNEPPCLNWLTTCAASFGVGAALEDVLEGAFDHGPLHLTPDLVSRVEVTKRPPFTLTYYIRPEARWSDGVPVTASDFVFTQNAIRKYVSPDWISDAAFQRTKVRSARPVGTKTVRVVLNDRLAAWRQLFAVVLPRHALAGVDLEHVWQDRIDNPKTGAPIGSGPFLVERWERGKELTLRRNPRYWGPHVAYLDRVVLRFDLSDLVQALRDGDVDVVHRRPDPGTQADLERLRGVEQLYGPGLAWEHFAIRIGPRGHPALKKKLVRRALAYGIDRAAIVRAVYGALLPRWIPSESAVFLTASHGYQRNWSRYRYRPTLARQLLERAGCHLGADGIYICDGERLSLRFMTIAGGANRRRIAVELAQSQLRRAGIEANPVYATGAALLGQDGIVTTGDFDVILFTWFYSPDQGGASDIYRCGGFLNYTGYCQRLVTRDLDNADRIFDLAQRARVLNRADRQMAKDVPVIPLWNEPAAVTVRSTVHGVVPCFPSLIWNAEDWWRAK